MILPKKSPLTIALQVDNKAWTSASSQTRKWVRLAANAAFNEAIGQKKLPKIIKSWRGGFEVSISLSDNAKVRTLNRDYRGKDKPTNVLSFAMIEAGYVHSPETGEPLLLGDIILAFETVASEAKEQNKPLRDHIIHLVVHGMLHLFGYDHIDDQEAVAMESLETSILAAMKIPDPYTESPS